MATSENKKETARSRFEFLRARFPPRAKPSLANLFAPLASALRKSLADANAELSAVSASLKKELDETLGADLTALSASDLRYRVAQLTAELHERSKWEALRLRAFMLSAERETADKYRGLMQEQVRRGEGWGGGGFGASLRFKFRADTQAPFRRG